MQSRSTPSRQIWSVTAVLAAFLLVAGCTSTEPTHRPTGPAVTTSGTGLLLDGKPWWPTGFDAYQLGTDWSVNAGCGAAVDLDAYFGALPPHSLTRFDAFATFAVDKRTGLLSFGPLDAVFAAAARHRQMVLPVLAAGDGACENTGFRQRDWYADGWRDRPAAANLTFADWITTAVTRWRDRGVVAGWELVGEPEPAICGDTGCTAENRRCPGDAAEGLRTFYDRAGAVVRELDPHRLIFSGLTGGGQCGTQGEEYRAVAAATNVDVLDYHDYSGGTAALPGDVWNGLGRRITQARGVGKPLMVAEIGSNAGSCRTTAERADDTRTKVRGQRRAGTAGALLWAFVPDARPNACSFDVGFGDPLWTVIADSGGPS
ncbi:beta-mannosidase [Williamsia sterculiae]|uniref:Cellulase (Glycosyl hydrolase family 5) n=1 Tax=Williamsia sterculiae TaxID=1344003 RepID=A0A1N7CU24_9NOCA|nr:beta-mannosidase [Williamsia sterculiae]SIR67156.1 hypothetical protein SAMN05445060_0366 [Williamsia sterculiae]